MENASKALIIAGAIMVSIMIVSLGVYIFNNFGGAAKENTVNRMNKQEIGSFNSRITPYLGNSIPGPEVNALIQYVISNNINCVKSGETQKAITITFPGNDSGISINGAGTSVVYGSNVKRVDTSSGKYYNVSEGYDSNGLITTITVTPKP